MKPTTTKYENRLRFEKSPYLLQHAHNPVDWHPWDAEAFAQARAEQKPIFLSIGYATCHWCHVMERESFEDPAVAKLMNAVFVSIKVDREERPDLDQVYMTVCQMLTGSGGWPLTIIMTPDQKPFFAGTYFPKESRFGQIGMVDLIARIQDIWTTEHPKAMDSADQITAALRDFAHQETHAHVAAQRDLKAAILDAAYHELAARFDQRYGGFGQAPKFPMPSYLLLLLRYWKRSGNSDALAMVERTLQAMRRGGMYDHLGFGFHRYATDAQWLLPHFEKMLYDQALLAMAYTEAYQATHNEEYARTAHEIFTYILRDLTAPTDGFYLAEDADSEGVEGKFYVWSMAEIRRWLESEQAELALNVFNFTPEGNFNDQATGLKTGENIIHLQKPLAELAADLGTTEPELRNRIETIRKKLFEIRAKRMHPLKDDKILTDWNGLMIAAFAKGAQVFAEPAYAQAAEQAAGFILDKMRRDDGRLLHRYRDGEAAIPAYADDYAFLIWGFLELYETTFTVNSLETALALNAEFMAHFADETHGGFYFTADDGEPLALRPKNSYDGVTPSNNAVALLNLLRLGRLTAQPELEAKAADLMQTFAATITQSPAAATFFLSAADFAFGPAYEVVLVGDSRAEDTHQMLQALRTQFLPNKVVLLRPTEQESPEILRLAPYLEPYRSLANKATAYICRNYLCSLPTTEVEMMLKLFK